MLIWLDLELKVSKAIRSRRARDKIVRTKVKYDIYKFLFFQSPLFHRTLPDAMNIWIWARQRDYKLFI